MEDLRTGYIPIGLVLSLEANGEKVNMLVSQTCLARNMLNDAKSCPRAFINSILRTNAEGIILNLEKEKDDLLSRVDASIGQIGKALNLDLTKDAEKGNRP